MKESPAKLGLIGVGLIAALGGVIWEAFRPIDSPTAMGADGQSDWLAIITQIGGVVAIVMGAFADIKKAIPPEAIASIRKMISEHTVDVGALISIYNQLDMAAILEIIKKLKGGIMPPVVIDGDIIKIDPKPKPDPGPTPPTPPPDDDESAIRQRLIELLSRFRKGRVKADIAMPSSTLKIEVSTAGEAT